MELEPKRRKGLDHRFLRIEWITQIFLNDHFSYLFYSLHDALYLHASVVKHASYETAEGAEVRRERKACSSYSMR